MVSSTSDPLMRICSFAARNRPSSSGSRVTSHPTRIPGNPYVFERLLTEITRSLSDAATGSALAERHLAVRLVDQQPRDAVALDEPDDGVERLAATASRRSGCGAW